MNETTFELAFDKWRETASEYNTIYAKLKTLAKTDPVAVMKTVVNQDKVDHWLIRDMLREAFGVDQLYEDKGKLKKILDENCCIPINIELLCFNEYCGSCDELGQHYGENKKQKTPHFHKYVPKIPKEFEDAIDELKTEKL